MNFFRMVRCNDYLKFCQDGYYSCAELEGAITLIHGAITMCGHVHSKTKGMPYVCSYDGGDIPIDELISARNELRRLNQTEHDTPCKGCQFLQKRLWGANEFPVDHITVGHYTPCNLQCTYCYTTKYSDEEKLRYNTIPYSAANSIESMVRQGVLAPNTTAWLTAGEPTLFADFESIMDVLVRNKIKTTIGTNCIKEPIKIVKDGMRSGLVEILCSVDSGTQEKYKEIKGKDYHRIVWRHLFEYSQINHENLIVKYIFMDENSSKDEVVAFIDNCLANGIKKISISRDILKYDGILSNQKQQMPDDMFFSIAFMYQLAVKSNIEVFFDVNWPVFSDCEILKIKLSLLEYLVDSTDFKFDEAKSHFIGIANLFSSCFSEAKGR